MKLSSDQLYKLKEAVKSISTLEREASIELQWLNHLETDIKSGEWASAPEIFEKCRSAFQAAKIRYSTAIEILNRIIKTEGLSKQDIHALKKIQLTALTHLVNTLTPTDPNDENLSPEIVYKLKEIDQLNNALAQKISIEQTSVTKPLRFTITQPSTNPSPQSSNPSSRTRHHRNSI
jgi:hypothetical protein